MARHWSGTRSGFATRGGTDKEHAQIALDYARALTNPDSWYWCSEARDAMHAWDICGVSEPVWTAFRNYFDAYLPMTWRDVSNVHKIALEVYQANPDVSAEALAHAAGILPDD